MEEISSNIELKQPEGVQYSSYSFYISGQSGRLTKAIQQFPQNILKETALVISDAVVNPQLQGLLEENHIPLETIEDGALPGTRKEKNLQISDFILCKLQEYKIDYLISFGSHLLCGELLEKYQYRLINFHPAILPMFPGQRAIDQAVEHGNAFLIGNTAHFIDAGMDTGKIIMQSVIPTKHFLDTQDYDAVLDLQLEMLTKLIRVIDENRLHIIDGRAVIDGADYSRSMIFPEI